MAKQDEQDEQDKTPIELGAAVASGWIAPASFPNKTTRGRYRTEWDGPPFPVTTATLEPEAVDQLRPIDYNGHMPEGDQ